MTVTIGTRTLSVGTLTAGGQTGETNLFTPITAKTECYIPEGIIDLSGMLAGDTYVVREYFKVDGINYRKIFEDTLSDVQSIAAYRVHPKVFAASATYTNRDYKVTVEKTAGTARDIPYAFVVLDYSVT